MDQTPTTELEAVNALIAVLGEAPINSLDGQLTMDVMAAQKTLHRVSRVVQTEGWQFNIEDEFELTPDVDGYINVPNNYIRVNPDPRYHLPRKITRRGTRLYDRTNHTYQFEDKVLATVTLFLPFEELPETARYYITVKAGREFQDEYVGSDTLHGFDQVDEVRARAILLDQEGRTGQYNILNAFPNIRR
ncbi:MAG: hypothetical protein KKE29_19955 [Proteobacteria bacterium]|nr:hypothetical protein [Pseudomonadota bacterium]MBV1715965.1 hypothetical protein [Desulfarculus sp.]